MISIFTTLYSAAAKFRAIVPAIRALIGACKAAIGAMSVIDAWAASRYL